MNAEYDEASKPEMFFFPYVGGGHILPMVDLARVFASHGAKSTIVAPPSAEALLQASLLRHPSVSLRILQLPVEHNETTNGLDASDMSAPPMLDTTALLGPLRLLLSLRRPHCLVADMFHHWAPDVADEIGIPRITFNGSGCFALCGEDSIRKYSPPPQEETVGSDYEPFVLRGLPDRIEFTRSQIGGFMRSKQDHKVAHRLGKAMKNSFGALVNSFYELEPAYADYYKKEIVTRAWLVGPVSLCNQNAQDRAERGGKNTSIEATSWLDSKPPASVLYICFGSLARLAPKQILEIVHGLEASNCTFVWALGKVLDNYEKEEAESFLLGFERRVMEAGKGLIIRGWAPQLSILEHQAIGGYLTHCGWNSTTEAVCAGVPVVTWPLSAEQFYNEKLLTKVLKVGVEVGSVEWASWNSERKFIVGREKVAEAVTKVMGGCGEAMEMRRRARELAVMAKRAVEEGGSSYADAKALIEELKAYRKMDGFGLKKE